MVLYPLSLDKKLSKLHCNCYTVQLELIQSTFWLELQPSNKSQWSDSGSKLVQILDSYSIYSLFYITIRYYPISIRLLSDYQILFEDWIAGLKINDIPNHEPLQHLSTMKSVSVKGEIKRFKHYSNLIFSQYFSSAFLANSTFLIEVNGRPNYSWWWNIFSSPA